MSTFWTHRRVLVTGATGVIGSWLIKELLSRGAHIVALIRDMDPQSELYRSGNISRVSVVNGALEDFWTLERVIHEHESDTVIHLGGQSIVGTAHRSPLLTFEANIRGTYNLLEACRLHSNIVQHVVIASSDKAYGEQPNLPYTEDMSLSGRHPYEVSKSCADLISQSYYHTFGLPVAIARCGNVYGGGDLNWSRIVPRTIRSLLRGKQPVIYGDGAYLRDYIYVKDIVRAYMSLAEHLDDQRVQGEAFNFSTESRTTVLEIVDVIRHLMKCEQIEPQMLDQVEGELANQYLSAAKAKRVLNWHPRFSLEEGLGETIAWYESFLAG